MLDSQEKQENRLKRRMSDQAPQRIKVPTGIGVQKKRIKDPTKHEGK
jgi:hypothetical protein